MSRLKLINYIVITLIIAIFTIFIIFNVSDGKPAKNMYPEFSSYNQFEHMHFYDSANLEYANEIVLTGEQLMILYSVLRNDLELGGGGRFLTTKSYSVKIVMRDHKQYIFKILVEDKLKINIIFGDRVFVSDNLLKWINNNESSFNSQKEEL